MEEYLYFPSLEYHLSVKRVAIPPLKPTGRASGWTVRSLNRMLLTQETFVMPRSSGKTGKAGNGFDVTFVNFKLAGEAKERFGAYMSDKPSVHSKALIELMSQGMKFSFSENLEHGFFMASVTCKAEGNINNNRCITSRSNDWYEALIMCVFKIEELGVEADWLDQTGDDNWG